jgi:HK97 family phage prohead protease
MPNRFPNASIPDDQPDDDGYYPTDPEYWLAGRHKLPAYPTPGQHQAFLTAQERTVAATAAAAAQNAAALAADTRAAALRHQSVWDYRRARERERETARLLSGYFPTALPAVKTDDAAQQALRRLERGAYLAEKPPWAIKHAVLSTLEGPLEVKAVGGEARFRGYASTFGNLDLMGDVVEAGAFRTTLAAAKAQSRRTLWPVLWSHDREQPIGGIVAAHEDSHGLAVEGVLGLDLPAGKQAYVVLANGYAAGLSIGYRTRNATHDRRGNRHITSAELMEVSVVPFPANTQATVSAVSGA